MHDSVGGFQEKRATGTPYKAHVPALDGVRGLAALGVMIGHLLVGTARTPLEQMASHVAATGEHGVDLFFALSGFLITGILYDSLHDQRFFRKFYARRVLRIFPLYYGVLLLFLLAGITQTRMYHAQLLSLSLYLQNTNLVAPPTWASGVTDSLPLLHFWSLAVEEQFYLIWPLAVFVLRKRERILAASIALCLVAYFARVITLQEGGDPTWLNAATFLRMDTLLVGAALAMMLRGPRRESVLRWMPLALVVAFLLNVVLLHVPLSRQVWGFPGRGTVFAIGSVGVLALALREGGVVERAFSIKPLRWLGKYSYGIYVLHVPLQAFLTTTFRTKLMAIGVHNKAVLLLMNAMLVGIVTFALAWISYHFYEKRFLKLKRFFEYRRHADTPTAEEVGAVAGVRGS